MLALLVLLELLLLMEDALSKGIIWTGSATGVDVEAVAVVAVAAVAAGAGATDLLGTGTGAHFLPKGE
jgi:hypothetical protein